MLDVSGETAAVTGSTEDEPSTTLSLIASLESIEIELYEKAKLLVYHYIYCILVAQVIYCLACCRMLRTALCGLGSQGTPWPGSHCSPSRPPLG